MQVRLRSIPGIGLLGASAIIATVQDAKVFRSGRDFAAWIGLVPREDFDRRQAEAWADLETGRSLFATHSGGRSLCGVETRAAEAGEESVAHATPGATTLQGRGGGARQQDGRRGLGVDGQGQHLAAPERFAKRQIPLAPRAPSIHGPMRPTLRCNRMSLSGADSIDRRNTLCFQSDTLERYAYGGACTDKVHAEAEGRTLRALEVRQMGGVRRPGARGTRAV